MKKSAAIKVLIVGFGPLGLRLAQSLLKDDRFILRAIVDKDPAKIGEKFSSIEIKDSFSEVEDVDLAFVTTSSQLGKIKDTIFDLAQKKINIVSSCEELIFPLSSHPDLSKEIDEYAKSNSIRVLGTGINPGYLMDYLISVLAKPFLKLKSIEYRRNINTDFRRESFKNKVGLGLTEDEFKDKKDSALIGHVGFRQSIDMLAHHFSWVLESYTENIEAVIEDDSVKGIDQKAIAKFKDNNSIKLKFKAFEANIDSDEIDLVFENLDKPLDVKIPSGINGETGTVSMLMNTVEKLLKLDPGLKTMLDL